MLPPLTESWPKGGFVGLKDDAGAMVARTKSTLRIMDASAALTDDGNPTDEAFVFDARNSAGSSGT